MTLIYHSPQRIATLSATSPAWRGNVEVFEPADHPTAKRCYGWTYGEPEKFITVLELPPVTDAPSAVKVGVSYQIKKARGK